MIDNKGFTLIEVLTATIVLSVGILTAATMQITAIKANREASYRSRATHVAFSFLEELKRLPFDHANLAPNTDPPPSPLPADYNVLNNGAAEALAGQALPATVDHTFAPADFPVFAADYQLNGSNLIDNAGRRFLIFWNIDDSTPLVGSGGASAYYTIRLFVFWDGSAGKRHLEFTTLKYNNKKV
ncbi:MAG: prepilin-type N-terminal cleavage/methylation domain-containing protein [Desulfocapsa sp.]|nr:prepilin-type N-terminal cleavage/methylation domain-containing protein [Desulfocapsa sp.]